MSLPLHVWIYGCVKNSYTVKCQCVCVCARTHSHTLSCYFNCQPCSDHITCIRSLIMLHFSFLQDHLWWPTVPSTMDHGPTLKPTAIHVLTVAPLSLVAVSCMCQQHCVTQMTRLDCGVQHFNKQVKYYVHIQCMCDSVLMPNNNSHYNNMLCS